MKLTELTPKEKRTLALQYANRLSDKQVIPKDPDEIMTVADHFLAGFNKRERITEFDILFLRHAIRGGWDLEA